jgi:hypothetical protein
VPVARRAEKALQRRIDLRVARRRLHGAHQHIQRIVVRGK